MRSVAIIGGGFSGTMTAIHLSRMADNPLKIFLVNKGNPIAKGVAFSTEKEYLLLNVKAGRMSAFAGEQDHFVNWILNNPSLRKYHSDSLREEFMPRKMYGQYLNDILHKYLVKESFGKIILVKDEAVNIYRKEEKWIIDFEQHESIDSDAVVLATGNFLPGNPFTERNVEINPPFYFPNPWRDDLFNNLKGDEDILFIGTGLTMIDHLLTLEQRRHEGKIFALSSKGYLPLPHEHGDQYPDFINEMYGADINKQVSVFKKHFRRIQKQGMGVEALINVLRPHTQQLWSRLSIADKKRFLRHIKHLWNIARHRIPIEVNNVIQHQIQKGQLVILKGKPVSFSGEKEKLNLLYRNSNNEIKAVSASIIINCTGPESALNRINSELYKNLLRAKRVEQEELRLGIKVTKEGEVYTDSLPFACIYAIGNLLKGTIWESTAVPELSMQAHNIAARIISCFYNKKNTQPIFQIQILKKN